MGLNLGRLGVALARGAGAYRQGQARREQMDFDNERELNRETLNEAFRRDQLDARRDDRLSAEQYRRDQLGQQEAFRRDQLAQQKALADANRAAAAERQAVDLQTRRDLATEGAANRENMLRLAATLRPDPNARLKPVPNAVTSAFLGNQKQLQTIDRTIAEIQANPGAVGAKALLPDMILNRLPTREGQGGVLARAGVGDIGSLIIHDRTGATMAVAEAQRLKPFIPSPTDDSRTAITKLNRLRQALAQESEAMAEFYTPEQGFRGLGPGGAAARPQADAGGDDADRWAAEYLKRRRAGKP